MLSQYDPNYATLPYGNGDLASSGCAIVTISMVASTLNKQTISPSEVDAIGQQIDANQGNGTIWSKMVQILEGYKLNVQEVPDNSASFTQIDDTLKAGGMVIIAGSGRAPFTPSGHVLAIRGKAADGNYLVADPNSPTNDPGNPQNEYSADQLLAANNPSLQSAMGIFLVTKP